MAQGTASVQSYFPWRAKENKKPEHSHAEPFAYSSIPLGTLVKSLPAYPPK
jgi:hypothetical protein